MVYRSVSILFYPSLVRPVDSVPSSFILTSVSFSFPHQHGVFQGFSSRRQPTMITNAPMMLLVLYFVLSPLHMRVGAGLYGVMAAPAQGYSHVERTNMRTSFFRHSVPENLINRDFKREVESTITTDKGTSGLGSQYNVASSGTSKAVTSRLEVGTSSMWINEIFQSLRTNIVDSWSNLFTMSLSSLSLGMVFNDVAPSGQSVLERAIDDVYEASISDDNVRNSGIRTEDNVAKDKGAMYNKMEVTLDVVRKLLVLFDDILY
ncbi:hypothetical protein F5050DRAFT_1785646 [Lentinula boryana]|uniref:Uncharacterized protein n=1 Tax=Lentinula boryana TaxID=40481 RepID=A0ABQ8Q2P2_9AGAR|nr:hypothetical protein F5050DRAFT_1785646 [Lentinula boryana]